MLKAALIGAGERGMIALASYALQNPHQIQFIAVAEPNEERRNLFAKLHQIPEEMQFASWEQMLSRPKLCEALLICTMDREHYAPTMAALDKGYHILLEKPMSHDPLETIRIAEKAEQTGAILSVCHGMRYNTFSRELKRIVDAKLIGEERQIFPLCIELHPRQLAQLSGVKLDDFAEKLSRYGYAPVADRGEVPGGVFVRQVDLFPRVQCAGRFDGTMYGRLRRGIGMSLFGNQTVLQHKNGWEFRPDQSG
ncbi:MAG: oxidoreductase family protein [Paenibacillaceae bacterium]|nr:oxidoreductase family protein [Paenibacillaceae bacterium]